MIEIEKWVKESCYEYETNAKERLMATEIAIAINDFALYSYYGRHVSKSTLARYMKALSLFGYELMREWWRFEENPATLRFYLWESFLPSHYCIDRDNFIFDEKALTTYENIVKKFWEHYILTHSELQTIF